MYREEQDGKNTCAERSTIALEATGDRNILADGDTSLYWNDDHNNLQRTMSHYCVYTVLTLYLHVFTSCDRTLRRMLNCTEEISSD